MVIYHQAPSYKISEPVDTEIAVRDSRRVTHRTAHLISILVICDLTPVQRTTCAACMCSRVLTLQW